MRIAIIGGGPAGFFAAIAAAGHDRLAEIIIFEAGRRVLEKVRISGGGRCNVTHHCFEPSRLATFYPRGAKQLRRAFERFQPRDTIAWFKDRGVALKAETDGRMFPTTDTSATIVDCLRAAASESGIQVRLGAQVKDIAIIGRETDTPAFEIDTAGHAPERFDRVLIATGGSPAGHRLAEMLGHTIIPPVPSLFTFTVKDSRIKGLAGVAFDDVKLTLKGEGRKGLSTTGPMLITHWGLSGPAVLKLSAWGARILHDRQYRSEMTINFLPEYTTEALYRKLASFREDHGRKRVHTGEILPIPRRYWVRVMETVGIPDETTWASITRRDMMALSTELTAAHFTIGGKGAFKEEFVTCGGVALEEVDFDTMQSRKCPGVYFAGEVLDIDGLTGGFNFQCAWTTGWIAGAGMVGEARTHLK